MDRHRKRRLPKREPKPPAQDGRERDPRVAQLDPQRSISPELASQLQDPLGNQALTALLERPAEAGFAADDQEKREEEGVAEEVDQEVEEERKQRRDQLAPTSLPASKGLPSTSSGGGMSLDQQYGGDEDDPLPLPAEFETSFLRFIRSGRGNQARLDALRAMQRIPPEEIEEASRQVLGAPAPDTIPAPVGDAVFRTPLQACHNPALLAGRELSPEALADLAGAQDPLGRPMAVGAFVERQAHGTMARSLARLCATVPGTLNPEVAGYCGAVARSATLASLALAAEGRLEGALRDRATHVALDEVALETVLDAAGDISQTVPPAPALYSRLTGQPQACELPRWRASETGREWLLPALARASQAAPYPIPPVFVPPTPQRIFDEDDPADMVDAALLELTGALPPPGPILLTSQHVRGLLDGIDALLAAGGRTQVELAAASLASDRPAFRAQSYAALQQAFQDCRQVAMELLDLRRELLEALDRPLHEVEEGIHALDQALRAIPRRLDAARQDCFAMLAAITERG